MLNSSDNGKCIKCIGLVSNSRGNGKCIRLRLLDECQIQEIMLSVLSVLD